MRPMQELNRGGMRKYYPLINGHCGQVSQNCTQMDEIFMIASYHIQHGKKI